MNCQNCGSELRAGAAFCTACGTRVEAETPPVTEENAPAEAVNEPVEAPPPPPPPAPPPPLTPPAPYTYKPPPQFYQPVQYPPVRSTPPVHGGPKKSQKGFIIGLTVGGSALIILAVILGLIIGRAFSENMGDLGHLLYDLESQTGHSTGLIPPSTPSPTVPPSTPEPPVRQTAALPFSSDDELAGYWEYDSGDAVWFFGLSEHIMIIDHDDGTYDVFESGGEEWGTGHIERGDKLIIEGEWSGFYEFTFILTGDRLSIIDSDGDTIHYIKVE